MQLTRLTCSPSLQGNLCPHTHVTNNTCQHFRNTHPTEGVHMWHIADTSCICCLHAHAGLGCKNPEVNFHHPFAATFGGKTCRVYEFLFLYRFGPLPLWTAYLKTVHGHSQVTQSSKRTACRTNLSRNPIWLDCKCQRPRIQLM